MDIKLIEITGFDSVLKALRLPYSLEPRSQSNTVTTKGVNNGICTLSSCNIDADDLKLMSALVRNGDEHAKCIRGLNVYLGINAPIYWFCELEQYNVGRTRISSESTMHTDCKGLSGIELVDKKKSIPMGRELTKIDMFNYQCLRHIYKQRKDHRLPEWKQFCEFIETLPFSKELITIQ